MTTMVVAYLVISIRRTMQLEHLTANLRVTTADLEAKGVTLAYMARHDFALTGLANRVACHDVLQRALHGAGRGQGCAVLLLDLDRFKAVNDTMGHHAGDALLCQVAHRLRNRVRQVDAVARLGGDEFAVVQADVRLPGDADTLAESLIAALGEPYAIDGHAVEVGASIGIVRCPAAKQRRTSRCLCAMRTPRCSANSTAEAPGGYSNLTWWRVSRSWGKPLARRQGRIFRSVNRFSNCTIPESVNRRVRSSDETSCEHYTSSCGRRHDCSCCRQWRRALFPNRRRVRRRRGAPVPVALSEGRPGGLPHHRAADCGRAVERGGRYRRPWIPLRKPHRPPWQQATSIFQLARRRRRCCRSSSAAAIGRPVRHIAGRHFTDPNLRANFARQERAPAIWLYRPAST